MPKFAIVSTLDIAPGRRDEFLSLLMAHKARCLKDEPGTIQFEVLRPLDDSTKVMLHEVSTCVDVAVEHACIITSKRPPAPAAE